MMIWLPVIVMSTILCVISIQFVFTMGFFDVASLRGLQIRRKLQHAMTGSIVVLLYTYCLSRAHSLLAIGLATILMYLVHRKRLQAPALNCWLQSQFGALLREHELYSLPGAFYFIIGCGISITVFPRQLAVNSMLHLSFGDPAASLAGTLWRRRYSDQTMCYSDDNLSGSSSRNSTDQRDNNSYDASSSNSKTTSGGGITPIQTGLDAPPGLPPPWVRRIMSASVGAEKCVAGCVGCWLVCALVTASLLTLSNCDTNQPAKAHVLLVSVISGLAGAVGEALPVSGLDDNLVMPLVSGALLWPLFPHEG